MEFLEPSAGGISSASTSMSHSSDEAPPSSLANFLKKPLYYWVKSFAEKEIHPGDNFKTFIGSNAVTYALEYIGITTEAEQSSLHLSSMFDEDGPSSFNSTNGSNCNSSLTKFSNHFESETKSRIQQLNKTFNELKAYFEDNFSQLVLIRPPNTVHVACSCQSCGVAEFEKILILLLGGAIQGVQRQDTIRKIKSYPSNIQEALIEAIKLAADNPELLHVKSWQEFAKQPQDDQQQLYERLLGLTRKLLMERNELFQAQLLSDYIHGYTSCEHKRNLEDWKCCEIYEAERNSSELKSTATMRQLRDELLEKSELLQECREELEITKVQMKSLQEELTDAQKQLKSFKKARDELDVLREGQEKAQRLESELQRMKKKLENSEQYYEKIEILQNENRNFQLKHAILMDQINMLTVDKERLELSFLTQSHYKGMRDDEDDENELSSLSLRNRSRLGRGGEELLIDTTNVEKQTPQSEKCESVSAQESNAVASTPATTSTASTTADLLEDITPIVEPSTSSLPILRIEEPGVDVPECSEKADAGLDTTLNADAEIAASASLSPKDKKAKRQSRKTSTVNTKRTRRALFSPSSSRNVSGASPSRLQTKCKLNGSIERIHQLSELESNKIAEPKSTKKFSPKAAKRSQRRRFPHGQPGVEDNDADEELSLSPNIAGGDDDAGPTGDQGPEQQQANVNEEEKENTELPPTIREYPDTTTIKDAEPHDDDDIDAISNISVGSSDNELFFICSSNATTSASNSNLKIANGRNVPIAQITTTTGSSTLRPSDSDAEEDNNGALSNGHPHPHCLRNHFDPETYTHDLLTNCNIQLSLRHVNSHDVNIGHPNALFEYPNATGGISSSTAYVNKLPKYSSSGGTPPVNFNLAHGSPCNGNANDGSSSSEDDDSVWYEYGCV